MIHAAVRNPEYDFAGESYADQYPNLHRYPAAMLPQIGIKILGELNIGKGKSMLDPYCGSGSSFAAGLHCGFKAMRGFDINPFAVLLSRAKFTAIEPDKIAAAKRLLRRKIERAVNEDKLPPTLAYPNDGNVGYWFSELTVRRLALIRHFLDRIADADVRRLFYIAFCEAARECSYTRNGEFKKFRMKKSDLCNFHPDSVAVFFNRLEKAADIYLRHYRPLLGGAKITVDDKVFNADGGVYDAVLTSPPYGDSRTTVAYGQFSFFANLWMRVRNANRIDAMMMGGKTAKNFYAEGAVVEPINRIRQESPKRALEVSSFYCDLEQSIGVISESIKTGGKAIYVVGNRTVKGIRLPTEQFIAECFARRGFRHLLTYERLLGNKTMPLKNSPSNRAGQVGDTMKREYIVVCEKIKSRSGVK